MFSWNDCTVQDSVGLTSYWEEEVGYATSIQSERSESARLQLWVPAEAPIHSPMHV